MLHSESMSRSLHERAAGNPPTALHGDTTGHARDCKSLPCTYVCEDVHSCCCFFFFCAFVDAGYNEWLVECVLIRVGWAVQSVCVDLYLYTLVYIHDSIYIIYCVYVDLYLYTLVYIHTSIYTYTMYTIYTYPHSFIYTRAYIQILCIRGFILIHTR